MKEQHVSKRSRFTTAITGGIFAAILIAEAATHAAVPTYFWDTNGTDDGPGNPPDAIWSGSSLTWTTDPYGTSPTFAYDTRANIVFAATGGAGWSETYDFTVSIEGTAHVSDITIQDANVTLTNLFGDLDKDTAPFGVLNDLQVATVYSRITSATGTSNGITKYAFGILKLCATNTYRGPTTIEGGVLRLGTPQALPVASPLVLANGGIAGYSDTAATFDTAGLSQNLGPLLLTGGNTNVLRTIDFGNGASALAFADSHTQDWNSIPLRIVNYTPGVDSLRFGTNGSGLSNTQLDLIQFSELSSVPGKIDSKGFVTPNLPTIQSVTQTSPTSYRLTWHAIPGRQYLIQYKNNLNDATWTDDGVAVIPATTDGTFDDEIGTDDRRFYRIALLPIQAPI